MRLLLITGAGASRNLNAADSSPIILMDEWVKVLRERFGPELSQLMGFDGVESGPDFEKHLGEISTWLGLAELNEKFAWMTSGTDAGRDDAVDRFMRGLANAKARGAKLETALDESLFEQFGPARFDKAAAVSAYDALLAAVRPKTGPFELVIATTNYDRSPELAWQGKAIRTGFVHNGIDVPRLDSDGLGEFAADPSLLYLHGAVGWYRGEEGHIVAYPASDVYRQEIGRPAVLYPSNDKIVEDTLVNDLWSELDHALEEATHVLVVGHGLNDSHLVRRLQSYNGRLAVSFFEEDHLSGLEEKVPDAMFFRLDFGPSPDGLTLLPGWS